MLRSLDSDKNIKFGEILYVENISEGQAIVYTSDSIQHIIPCSCLINYCDYYKLLQEKIYIHMNSIETTNIILIKDYILQIIKPLQNPYIVYNGGQLKLDVLVNYNKELFVKWFKNGICIDSNLENNIKLVFENGLYSLLIEKTDSNKDFGNYTFALNYNNQILTSMCYVIIKGIYNNLFIRE